MLGERDELRHRSECLIQTVKLIGFAAGAGGQAEIAVQGAIDAAVVGEVKNWRTLNRCDCVLIRMNVRDGRAAVSMCEIEERIRASAAAGRRKAIDAALVDIDGSGVEIGGGSIWHCRECEVVSTSRCPTAVLIATVSYAVVINRRPV